MATTIKVKAQVSGGIAQVKSLMMHPMETGTRREPANGFIVEALHITQLTFSNNGKPVMIANFSTAISRDPYFSFKFEGASVGDTLKVAWVDNAGGSDELETVLE